MEKVRNSNIHNMHSDQELSYFKYCQLEPVPIASEKMGLALKGPMDYVKALPFTLRHKLLEMNQTSPEVGYCVLPDGTGYASDFNLLEGVTTEMLEWWFAWRGYEPLRYKISNPADHLEGITLQMNKGKDHRLSFSEKLWDTTQRLVRVGNMGPEVEFINFKCPSDLGFTRDIKSLKNHVSIICGRVYGSGNPPFAKPEYTLCHIVRAIDGGVEVRSHYWMGWTVANGRDFKALPDGFRMPPMLPMGMLIQNMKEWANLAVVLPQLYAEECNQI